MIAPSTPGFSLATKSSASEYSSATGSVITIVELGEGRECGSFTGHRGPITGLGLARSDRALVSVGEDASVRVWATKTKRELARALVPWGLTCVAVIDDVIVAGDRAGHHLIFDVDWAGLGLA